MMKRTIAAILIVSCLAGCGSRQFTNTPRSAVEQMLLSGAVDRALEKLDLPAVKDRKVHLDFANLKTYDVEYVRVAARARFAQIGAVLVDKPEKAEYIAEVASGGLGIEYKRTVVGLPPLPVPNSPIPTPELSAYTATEQTGIIKLLIFVHKDGRLVAIRRCYAKCDRDERSLFGVKFQKADDIRTGWEAADTRLETK